MNLFNVYVTSCVIYSAFAIVSLWDWDRKVLLGQAPAWWNLYTESCVPKHVRSYKTPRGQDILLALVLTFVPVLNTYLVLDQLYRMLSRPFRRKTGV